MGRSGEYGPGWRVLHLVPLTLTLVPVPVCAALAFLYAAVRGRSKRWGWVAAGYGFGGLLLFPLLAVPLLCAAVWLAAWIGAMVYAFRIRHELLERAQAVSESFGGGSTWLTWNPPREAAQDPAPYVAQAADEPRPLSPAVRRCRYCNGLMNEPDRECRACGAPA